MEKHFDIPYESTGYFSNLFLDYINQDKKLASFYKYPPEINSFSKVIADKSKETINRDVLVKVLEAQYSNLSSSEFSKSNITALLDSNTFTVTTGHQLGLFTGELYFIYKIITCINLAKEIEAKNNGVKVVPIFWMATEDHDFEEINHAIIQNTRFDWKKETKGAVGRVHVKEVATIIKSLDHFLGNSIGKKELISLFTDAYQNTYSLAQATRCLVNELFKEDGLVILDADHPLLKKEFSEIKAKDIFHQISFSSVTKSSEALAKNYPLQVNPREINFFYLKDQYRERIIQKGTHFETVDAAYTFTKEELAAEIKSNPENFSPNVLMRPLYQEKILPNLAYIGGPGELSYWLQLKEMFEHFEINFPLLAWRNSFLLLEEIEIKKIQSHLPGLNSIFERTETLINDYVKKHTTVSLSLTQEKLTISQELALIRQKLGAIDQTLDASLKGPQMRIERMLDKLELKMLKAEKKKHQIAIQQISNVKERLFPNGGLQERVENFSFFYANHPNQLLEVLKEQSEPLSKNFKIVVL